MLRFLSETSRSAYYLMLAYLPAITQAQSPWPFRSLCKFILFKPCTCLEPFAWNIFPPVLGLHDSFFSFWSQLKGHLPVAFPSRSFIPQSHPLPRLCLTVFTALSIFSVSVYCLPVFLSHWNVSCMRAGVLSLFTAVSLAPRTGPDA